MYYYLHTFEDHVFHFYFLGGPDFIVGPDAEKGSRNILGVIEKVGLETGKKVILIRKAARDLISEIAGKAIHPVLGLPGGVAKQVNEELRERLKTFSVEMAFRAYDPCFGCATHSRPGKMPLEIRLNNSYGELIGRLVRGYED